MKKILLVFLLSPFISKGQIKDTSQIDQRLQKASTEMIRFDKQFSSGAMIEVIGGIMTVVGSTRQSQQVTIIGAVLALAGFFMNVSSSAHIKKAGIYLRGNTLIIPLRK